MWNSPKVGVLGGGQLGRMLMESANRLNIQMNILDAENAPAKQISAHDGHVVGSFKDRESVRKLAKSCDVLTAEIEHVDTYALEEVASEVKVEPSWQAIRTIQNKLNQKKHLSKYGIPMAEYRELVQNSPEELEEIGEQLGYPMMLKSQTLAYDGRGEKYRFILNILFFLKKRSDFCDAQEITVCSPRKTFQLHSKPSRADHCLPKSGHISRWFEVCSSLYVVITLM